MPKLPSLPEAANQRDPAAALACADFDVLDRVVDGAGSQTPACDEA